MQVRISDLLDGIEAPDYLMSVPDPDMERRILERLRPPKRHYRPLRLGLIAACLSVLLLTAVVAAGVTLASWLRGELNVPESAAYEEYEERTFTGEDFDVTVISAVSGESYAQVFVGLTGLPKESMQWTFILQRLGSTGPMVFGNTTAMEYMEESGTLILELDIPLVSGELELALGYVRDGYSSWLTKFSVTLPGTDYLSAGLSIPSKTGAATADSLDISLNSIKLYLNVPEAKEYYTIFSHRADYSKEIWDQNKVAYETCMRSLLREFEQVTVHFSDGTSRIVYLAWQGEPGKDGKCILEAFFTREFLDLRQISAVTVGGHTVTME